MKSLVEMRKVLEHGTNIGLTLDGPRGPRRRAHPGVAILSIRAGVPVVPNAFVVLPVWRMKSWDRTMVPKPFARIICAYGCPIDPPGHMTGGVVAAHLARIETSLNALHESIEREFGVYDFEAAETGSDQDPE